MNTSFPPNKPPYPVRRLFPASIIQVLLCCMLLGLWLIRLFKLPLLTGTLLEPIAGWRIVQIFPANVTFPLTVIALLIFAWQGAFKFELATAIALWLQCVAIATWVPPSSALGTYWIRFTLLLYFNLIWRGLQPLPKSRDFTNTSKVHRTGAIVIALLIVAILDIPLSISQSVEKRDDNPLYAFAHSFYDAERPAPATTGHIAHTGEEHSVPSEQITAVSSSSEESSSEVATDAANPIYTDTRTPNCPDDNSLGQDIESIRKGATSALEAALTENKETDTARTMLFQRAAAALDPAINPSLSRAISRFDAINTGSGLLTMLEPRSFFALDLRWTMPIVDQRLGRYTVTTDQMARSSQSSHSSEHTTECTKCIHVFSVPCDWNRGATADSGKWIYLVAGTTSAMPQTVTKTDDKVNHYSIKLTMLDAQRAARIVDFARYTGMAVNVSLALRKSMQLTKTTLSSNAVSTVSGEQAWRGLSWGIDATMNVPAVIIAGEETLPAALVHVRGDDICLNDTGMELTVDHAPAAPVTGIVLMNNSSLASLITVSNTGTTVTTHDNLRVFHTITKLELAVSNPPDARIESARFETEPHKDDQGNVAWTQGPWSWVNTETRDENDQYSLYDQAKYSSCDAQ